MIALLTSKAAGYVYAAIIAGLLAWWGYTHVYNNGYAAALVVKNAELAQIQLDYEKERKLLAQADSDELRRQADANTAAKQREAEAVADLERLDAENSELRKRLALEARQDPDADKSVLGTGSVQRINKVR